MFVPDQAEELKRAKIIVFTRHGMMGKNVSNLRPEHAPIFAFTPAEQVRRQLAIWWGVYSVRIDFTKDPNATINAAEAYLHDEKLAAPGDQLVVISDILAEGSRFDCVQLRIAK